MKANLLFAGICALTSNDIFAQPDTLRIPYGHPYSVTLTPDARSAGLGDAGVALSADANAIFWNASKLATAERDFGVSASYAPWLRNLVSGMWLGYASAYKKLGQKQAVGMSVQYFDYDAIYAVGGSQKASDITLSGTYSRQLGQHFSMGATLKYISSDIGVGVAGGYIVQNAKAVAGDLSVFYHKQIKSEDTGEDFNWSLGAVISNVGGKINYGLGVEYFLPTTLRVGGGLSYTANGKHRLNVIADLSKLMVPTPNYAQNPNSKPLIKGIIGSFSDAPGGFREEVQEISISTGIEYWYKNMAALRVGYYGENENKGDRRYFTLGAGGRILKNYTADLSYLIPVTQGSPFARTVRVSVGAYFGSKKG